MTDVNRPEISSLACVVPECELYGQAGKGNLRVRKVYGQDKIRYLRCSCCAQEFSERKNTALWNTKIPEARAIEVSRQLAEGTSMKGTARLTHTSRVTRKLGDHGMAFHEQTAQTLEIDVLEMDVREASPIGETPWLCGEQGAAMLGCGFN